MPEEYLTDDEQLEHVKRLTAEYGPWMLGAVVRRGFLFEFLRHQGYRNERAMQAASRFTSMASALQHNDRAQARQVADDLIRDFPNSPYADQAKMTLARLAVDDGQDANAIPPLTQVMENSKDSESSTLPACASREC